MTRAPSMRVQRAIDGDFRRMSEPRARSNRPGDARVLAAAAFALDPIGAGIVVRSGPGPARDAWLAPSARRARSGRSAQAHSSRDRRRPPARRPRHRGDPEGRTPDRGKGVLARPMAAFLSWRWPSAPPLISRRGWRLRSTRASSRSSGTVSPCKFLRVSASLPSTKGYGETRRPRRRQCWTAAAMPST